MQMFAAFVLAATTVLAHVREHAPPPDFTITSAKGTKRLYDLRGKVVVLNFWATWCPPCTDELKYFVRASHMFGSRIDLLTISSEPHDVAASYLRATVVIDPSGRVSYISQGGLSWDELRTAILSALATPAPGTPGPGVLR